MSEEVKAKVKALFPENVEGIYISKNDYDRLYGDLTLENIELKQEIERLNNIINKGIEAINVYQDEKTLSVGYQDLKRIRGILQGNEFDLQMFEEYLKELGEKNENE